MAAGMTSRRSTVEPSIAMSCVAEASAPMNAKIAKLPILATGSVITIAIRLRTITAWHDTIQLLRRPSRPISGNWTRSTTGDHRNLNA